MTAIDSLRTYLAETEDYRRIFDHLRFDQQCYMPDAATPDRARQIGLMERNLRERTSSPELARLLEAVEATNPDEQADFPTWAIARVARRDFDLATSRPIELMTAFQATGSEAFYHWRQARAASDWKTFAPYLQRVVDINLRLADSIGYDSHPQDALLSMYEPALNHAETEALLSSVAEIVQPLNARRLEVAATKPKVEYPRLGKLEVEAYIRDIGASIGFDWQRGGFATSPHGFTSPSGSRDVRFTVRDDVPFPEILKTAVHELGHALYEQGISPDIWGTSASRGVMPYLHESQAKFWENIVGREPEYAEWAFDLLRPYMDEVPAGFTPETLHEAGLYGPTSLIRIGTDELSFNLHIYMRWQIECMLLTGEIGVMDVPDVWNAKSKEYFGREPANDAEGCLQDPHWCHRYMGLFTSYVIGNVVSCQLWKTMQSQGLDVNACIRARDTSPLLDWLRTNVHAPGRTYTLREVVQSVTGGPLSVEPFREHLNRRYGA